MRWRQRFGSMIVFPCIRTDVRLACQLVRQFRCLPFISALFLSFLVDGPGRSIVVVDAAVATVDHSHRGSERHDRELPFSARQNGAMGAR